MAVFCRNCGASMTDEVRFCAACGAPTPAPPTAYSSPAYRPLVRPRVGRMLAGVCQGIANRYGWDPAVVRVVAVISAIFAGGLGAVAYIVMWVVVPEEPLMLPAGMAAAPPYAQPPYTPPAPPPYTTPSGS